MKTEVAVAILASEGLAQVAVSCQHARRSFVPLFFSIALFGYFLHSEYVGEIKGTGIESIGRRVQD